MFANIGDVKLTDAGAKVVVSANPPASECQNRGIVIGGTRGASTTPAAEHMQRAFNDARNKAAQTGANYLQNTTPQLTQGEYGPTGATVQATAFVCPAQAVATAPQPVTSGQQPVTSGQPAAAGK
ncbi:MAG: Membrane protein [Myxococcales bacterium]|nr:Membrane protein [Myxococcales bacterium]